MENMHENNTKEGVKLLKPKKKASKYFKKILKMGKLLINSLNLLAHKVEMFLI